MDDFERDDTQDQSADDQQAESTSEDTSDAAGESTEEGEDRSAETIRRLQSERDKARAGQSKAEKALAKVQAASAKDEGASSIPPEVQEWLAAAKDNSRDALYKASPKLEQYGVDPGLITGDTPAEMRKSAESIDKFVAEMEGTIRNQVLEEHGFNPEPITSPAEGRKSYNEMSKEDFDAEVAKALRG
jgi:hypothetical protein